MLTKASTHCSTPLGARSVSKRALPRVIQHPELTDLEKFKVLRRRIQKAERDERMDITKALTPVKTYMGGFTRPQDLRASNWWPGGRYNNLGKVYEGPTDSAYEPHTVVLLESRYNIVHEIGRADAVEHVIVVCREGDLPRVLEVYNSKYSPEIEAMENARWPWSKQKREKLTMWWNPGENPHEEISKLWEGEGPGFEVTEADIQQLMNEQDYIKGAQESRAASRSSQVPNVPTFRRRRRVIPLANSAARSSPHNERVRMLHTSGTVASDDVKSTGPAERAQITLSSWSKPPKASQDASDDVVPAYYIERKRQLDDISERKEEEGGLMAELSAGILSEGIAAQTRVREEKIPVEVREEDGVVRHPSGFEPPTPETEFHPVAAKPNVVEDPLLTTVKLPWDEALAPSADAEIAPQTSTSPLKSTRGLHTSALVRAVEAANLPFHVLNASAQQQEDSSIEAAVETDSVEREEYKSDDAWELEEDENASVSQLKVGRKDTKLGSDRGRWLASLRDEPFWRPMLSVTFSTRPLALSFARLSRALPRGTPYYTVIPTEDRKNGKSFSRRMRQMRLQRMRALCVEIARLLHGERGGFVGIRFGTKDRGRSVGGERLESPLPLEKRVIKVGVAEWDRNVECMKEVIQQEAADAGLSDGIQVFGIDQFGKRTDGVEWTPVKESLFFTLSGAAFEHLSPEAKGALTKRERETILENFISKGGRREIALALCKRHRSVFYPPPQTYKTQENEIEIETVLADLASEDHISTAEERAGP